MKVVVNEEKNIRVRINSDEYFLVLGCLIEVWGGLTVDDFEIKIGVNETVVKILCDQMRIPLEGGVK